MRESLRPVLIDVTRLVSRSWTRRRSTGIDRVCYAYLRQYRHRALAVVQHRGMIRVLGYRRSDQLFDMLLAPSRGFRAKFAAWFPAAFFGPAPAIDLAGLTYLNVSHTDFDLTEQIDWIERNRLRPVYFVHDLIPILRPDLSRPHAVARHQGRVRRALRHAEVIVVASQVVARDLAAYARSHSLRLPRIVIAPLAGQDLFAQPAGKTAARREDRPHFVCVGTIEPRKNHALLLDVWTELADRLGDDTPVLTIAGQTGPMTGTILDPLRKRAGLSRHVSVRHDCRDAELAGLVANASALLFPSLAEGFGLPLVEGLAAGTPVIASDIPIFREIGQGCAQLIDPGNPAAWRDAICAAAGIPVCHDTRAARADAFAAPSWADHFELVEAAIMPGGLKTASACESSLVA
ncbi:glycosyltransferase family 4 protein [Qipengyuania nanhaisediminis]|uniref:glycosyltransferase family 4 protein n=1 Tax=Qipengyuania nanhaisediminis TaxID=604088 RepID=UPI0038B314BE